MSTSPLGGSRSAVEIVHEILSLCNNGGIHKTAIMYRGNLSDDQLRKYLSMLCGEELIAGDETGQFQITSGGQKILSRMANAMKTLRELRRELGNRPVAVPA
jgi:predicted transcriptional regulator|tara:strand:- start:287 stop:592 length:306 start_codon:yes stop_codon:yes gene_type:complete